MKAITMTIAACLTLTLLAGCQLTSSHQQVSPKANSLIIY